MSKNSTLLCEHILGHIWRWERGFIPLYTPPPSSPLLPRQMLTLGMVTTRTQIIYHARWLEKLISTPLWYFPEWSKISMRKITFKTSLNPSTSLDVNWSSLNTNPLVKLKTTSCSGRQDTGYWPSVRSTRLDIYWQVLFCAVSINTRKNIEANIQPVICQKQRVISVGQDVSSCPLAGNLMVYNDML